MIDESLLGKKTAPESLEHPSSHKKTKFTVEYDVRDEPYSEYPEKSHDRIFEVKIQRIEGVQEVSHFNTNIDEGIPLNTSQTPIIKKKKDQSGKIISMTSSLIP